MNFANIPMAYNSSDEDFGIDQNFSDYSEEDDVPHMISFPLGKFGSKIIDIAQKFRIGTESSRNYPYELLRELISTRRLSADFLLEYYTQIEAD